MPTSNDYAQENSSLPPTRTKPPFAARLGRMALLALTVGAALSRGDVIQPTVELPPALGAYTFDTFCLTALSRCTTGATVSGFTNLTHTISSGNELVTADATYSADIYTDNSGTPGTFIGTLVMSGFINFTYSGRNPSINPLGTFATIVSDFGFVGTLGGNAFEIRQNPGQTSAGFTTINQFSVGPPVSYIVSSSVGIFAQYSFNGSPFVDAPERTGSLTAIPEPGTGSAAMAAIAGVALAALKKRAA